MKKHRYKTSFIITTLLYVTTAYGILYTLSLDKKPNNEISTSKAITLSLSSFEPEPKVQIEKPQPILEQPSQKEQLQEDDEQKAEKTDTKEVIKEEKESDTKKVIKEKTEKEIEKKPIEKTIEQKLTTANTSFKVTPKKHKRAKHKKYTKRTKHKKNKRILKSSVSKHKSNKKAKTTLLSMIRYKINHAKIYPRAAKRRHIEGKVYAKFRVLKNGQVSHINLSGSSIFFNATKKAIQKAFPIHTKDSKKVLPLDISITLRYNLTNN